MLEAGHKVRGALQSAGIRTRIDEREGLSPGFKFNDWEMRGVPLRVEIGPRDVAKGTLVLARRDKPGKEGKSFVPQEGVGESARKLLAEIQQALFDRALAFRTARTAEPRNYEELKAAVETGFASAFWCGNPQCEEHIKQETRATTRCIPLEQEPAEGPCIYCGQPAREKAVFARAY